MKIECDVCKGTGYYHSIIEHKTKLPYGGGINGYGFFWDEPVCEVCWKCKGKKVIWKYDFIEDIRDVMLLKPSKLLRNLEAESMAIRLSLTGYKIPNMIKPYLPECIPKPHKFIFDGKIVYSYDDKTSLWGELFSIVKISQKEATSIYKRMLDKGLISES